MAEEMNFDDFLRFIDDLGQPLPYSQGTLRLLLDSLSILVAQWGTGPRTAEWFGKGLENIAKRRLSQVAGVSSSNEEIDRLIYQLGWQAVAYQHEWDFEREVSMDPCLLQPPCQYHRQ